MAANILDIVNGHLPLIAAIAIRTIAGLTLHKSSTCVFVARCLS